MTRNNHHLIKVISPLPFPPKVKIHISTRESKKIKKPFHLLEICYGLCVCVCNWKPQRSTEIKPTPRCLVVAHVLLCGWVERFKLGLRRLGSTGNTILDTTLILCACFSCKTEETTLPTSQRGVAKIRRGEAPQKPQSNTNVLFPRYHGERAWYCISVERKDAGPICRRPG